MFWGNSRDADADPATTKRISENALTLYLLKRLSLYLCACVVNCFYHPNT